MMSGVHQIGLAESAPFVHIGLRYGGPMLNTAATRTYWNELTRNNAVFSKFVVSSFPLSLSGSGGEYLKESANQFPAKFVTARTKPGPAPKRTPKIARRW